MDDQLLEAVYEVVASLDPWAAQAGEIFESYDMVGIAREVAAGAKVEEVYEGYAF